MRAALGVVLALGLLAGCGSSARPAAPARPAVAPAAEGPAAAAVIRAWAAALARGDIAAAGAYFALPSTVQVDPAEPVATVRTAADARAVNLALPCGARLLDTRPVDSYVDALFLLGRRPGADCGAGVGGTARVAFVIRAGKIAVWRRLADEPGDASRAAHGYRAPVAPQPSGPRPSLI
jgi:hypothetical protein